MRCHPYRDEFGEVGRNSIFTAREGVAPLQCKGSVPPAPSRPLRTSVQFWLRPSERAVQDADNFNAAFCRADADYVLAEAADVKPVG